ncbi:MAG: FMN-binding protein [Microbacterium sp. SCN 70-200]|uniref:FMN-binding protein n=1 Tax=unclassified Microbacterium TaxID=2609290 RepID=UPI00086F26DF|nr:MULTISPECIES: FMN-binding protein [unclassified Microbacterium]MBN9213729.1 FMN-binding protein [Microbacterium sp.]ODT40076.1 MAG: FMN-binding protein [Microbacterium sp. SCN 70-200]OJV79236.1 MAG: FMN-binding protein [Microbacterium sp. 70-16]
MKKIVYGLLATLSGLVLLFSYRTSLGDAVVASEGATTAVGSAAAATSGSSTATSTPSASTTPTATSTPSESTAGSSTSASTATLADGTYTGSSVNTRYGPVQVQITVAGGLITDVQAVDYPDGNGRDRQINARAIPILVSETLDAQSAEIDFVSGATYTSDGYQQSLQSALDEAAA